MISQSDNGDVVLSFQPLEIKLSVIRQQFRMKYGNHIPEQEVGPHYGTLPVVIPS